MNFGVGGSHSVILMSVRANAPYRDRIEDGGTTLVYEGHDNPKSVSCLNPKAVDQPGYYSGGTPTQNGKFFEAAIAYKSGKMQAERVRVYEKIRDGIWTYNGVFLLVDSWVERDELRSVYKFKLVAIEGNDDFTIPTRPDAERRRVVPTHVKLEVWKRDGGKCSVCGATDELHFDHILPFSKGGTSLTSENIQLLCARHNLQKRDRIE
ncbi:MAG: HNH endonuclease [Proteobacteria bacterium]|nr:HNH endonuclease [Pseudomonadota bacterium]MBU1596005.1 HNH endonuclease [Pseudomonadota bacterium]